MKIKGICKTFALPRGRKSFADHFDFHFDGKFENITKNVYLLYKLLLNLLFSKLYSNIVLRDRRAGGYGFCKPAGVISSQGSEAPEG